LNFQKKIDFIDLSRQRQTRNSTGYKLEHLINQNLKKVFKHGKYILGPEISELEEKLCKFIGAKHCISVSSGTDALLLALMALDIKRGDEVITTPFSFISTSEVISLIGAKPIFVDIDPNTYNINPKGIEGKINKKTKAILPVSLYGQTADFVKINEIARNHNIPVIEDAAQSFGAIHNKKKSCNLSDIAATSFFPSKPLGCYGDGGACFTNNDELAKKIRRISLHGQEKRYFHTEIGINGRLDTMQAAILLAKLNFYESEIKKREFFANYYNKKLNSIGIKTTPFIDPQNRSVYAQYTIQINNRKDFQKKLSDVGIPTAVHYPTILPLQPVYESSIDSTEAQLNYKNAYQASKNVISLPFHPYLKKSEVDYIVDKIKEVIEKDSGYISK